MRDPYDVLGVSKTASEAEIKKAFRVARQESTIPTPRAATTGAKKKFQEISARLRNRGRQGEARRNSTAAKSMRTAIRAASTAQGFEGAPFGRGGGGGGRPRDFHFTWANQKAAIRPRASGPKIFSPTCSAGAADAAAARRARARISTSPSPSASTRRRAVARGGSPCPTAAKSMCEFLRASRTASRSGSRARAARAQRWPAGDVLLTVSVAPHP